MSGLGRSLSLNTGSSLFTMPQQRLQADDLGRTLDNDRMDQEPEGGYGSLLLRARDDKTSEIVPQSVETSGDAEKSQPTPVSGQSKEKQNAETTEGAFYTIGFPPRIDSANGGISFMNEPLPPMPSSPRPQSLLLSTSISDTPQFLSVDTLGPNHSPPPQSHFVYRSSRSSKMCHLLSSLPALQTSTLQGNTMPLKKRSPLGRDKIPGPSSRQPLPLHSPTDSPSPSEPVSYKSVNGPRYRRTSAILRAELGYEPMFIPVRSPSPVQSPRRTSNLSEPGPLPALPSPWLGSVSPAARVPNDLPTKHPALLGQVLASGPLSPMRNSRPTSPMVSGMSAWISPREEDSYPEQFAPSSPAAGSSLNESPIPTIQSRHHPDSGRPVTLPTYYQAQSSIGKGVGNIHAATIPVLGTPFDDDRLIRTKRVLSSGVQTIQRQQKTPVPEIDAQAATATGGGASSQPQPSGGLFGATATSSQPAQAGSLFGSTLTQPPQQQQGGLFGGGATASTQAPRPAPLNLGAAAALQPAAPSTGGLFGGSTAAATPSQPASGGLFGAAAPAASKPGGLFGGAAATSAPAAGGLFGNTAAQPASTQTAAGGLFGSSISQPQSTQPAAGGLFGNTVSQPASTQPAAGGLFGAPAASAPATGGGLFGSALSAQPAASQPAAGGLFGARPAASTGGLFGGPAASTQAPPAASSSLFGALNNANTTNQPAQQTVPAVKIDWSNVKPTTRFNELHQEVQDAIVFIDEVIQGAMKASMQCSEAIPGLGRQIEALPADVEYLDRRLETVEGALGRDAVSVAQNKTVVERDTEDAVRLFRAIENLKLPNQFHYSATIGSGGFPSEVDADTAGATDLLGYFSARTAELEEQMASFERYQREVDTHLRTVEHSAVEGMQKLGRRNGEGGSTGEGLREIAGVMRTFEDAILRVAERVGEGRERVVDLSLG